MLLIRPLLIERKPLKLVLIIDNFKSMEFGSRYTTYNKANYLYQFNNTSESYPGAQNTCSIVCSFRWW